MYEYEELQCKAHTVLYKLSPFVMLAVLCQGSSEDLAFWEQLVA